MQKGDDNDIEGVLVLVKGRDARGESHYAYAAITPSKYMAFQAAQAAGAYNLSDFGAILHHGKGLEPSLEVQKELEEKYGACHDFAEKLMEAMKNLPT